MRHLSPPSCSRRTCGSPASPQRLGNEGRAGPRGSRKGLSVGLAVVMPRDPATGCVECAQCPAFLCVILCVCRCGLKCPDGFGSGVWASVTLLASLSGVRKCSSASRLCYLGAGIRRFSERKREVSQNDILESILLLLRSKCKACKGSRRFYLDFHRS